MPAPYTGEVIVSARRIRPLLVAEACNPEWVSVPLEGWSHACAIAGLTDAHLVTQIRNRDAIARTGLTSAEFTAIDSEALAKPLYRLGDMLRGGAGKGWTTAAAFSAISYPYFEHLVWQKFGERIRKREFDVVHRLTPLSPTTVSSLAVKCHRHGVPFIMGPLNGGVPWPKQFDQARRREKEWLSYVRDAYQFVPGFHATRASAAAMIIGSRDTWVQVPRSFHRKCVYIPENAIEPARFTARRTRRATTPLRAIFVGRLVPYKGADMLLHAAAPFIKVGTMQVDIIGDGPEMLHLQRIVAEKGLAGGVRLPGWVEHHRLQEWLLDSDVFAFPSIREFGGAVVLEAMAVGVVPIIAHYGGPAELVTPETGYSVPMGSREEIIARFKSVFETLVAHPEQIDQKSTAALARVAKHFTWHAKAKQVLEVYQWVLGQRAEKPDNPIPLQ